MSGIVQLRGVTEDDLPILFEQQRDPDAYQMAAFLPRDWDAFMAHWKKIMSDAAVTIRAILLDGQIAGNIGSFDRADKRLVGYWLGKDYWGKGVATRALGEFLNHDQTRPLFAHVAKHNRASIRVLEKCGFTICGEEKVIDGFGEVEEWILRLDTKGSK